MSDLKPCPFCGSEPKELRGPKGSTYHPAYMCSEEKCSYRSKRLEDWNSRPIEDQLRAEREKLIQENQALLLIIKANKLVDALERKDGHV